jgi:hypothetical protein
MHMRHEISMEKIHLPALKALEILDRFGQQGIGETLV